MSVNYPKVTNLLKHRINFVRPLIHTEIDFIGHLWIEDGNEMKKMYILIFTYFNVTAIHIELVEDMFAHSVILAFVKVFNLYGVPIHIYTLTMHIHLLLAVA